MDTWPRFALVAVLLAAFCAGCNRIGVDSLGDSHQEMLDALKEIKERTAEEIPFLGEAEAVRLRSKLESLPPESSDRFRATQELAHQELRLGQTQQAIEHYLEADRILQQSEKRPPDPTQIGAGDFDSSIETDREHLLFDLGLAYLREAENQNCVNCQNGESCLLPLRGGGVHRRKTSARKASEYFTRLLERNPDHLAARWLLNVASMAVGTYPDGLPPQFAIPPEKFQSAARFPRFNNVAGELGLNTRGLSGGVIIDEFDGDGLLDIVVSSVQTSISLKYFHHETDGTYTDQSARAGFEGILGGLNLVQADYDNDGDVDFLVLRGGWWGKSGCHPKSLLQNDGAGRFRDVSFEAGLETARFPSQTGAWADYDNDGDLDLYIGNETTEEAAYPNQLFENQGDGTFENVAHRAGVENLAYCKGVVWGDYDGDRFPDLYVSNLGAPNRLYHNNRDGTFSDVADAAGVAGPTASFPAWFWDFNNDGALDIYVGAFWSYLWSFVADQLDLPDEAETDRLYQGDGTGNFLDVSHSQGIDHVTLPMGCNFGDLDNDGFQDFFLGTGTPDYALLIPDRLFHNLRGQRFEEVTYAADMGHLQKGHGVAFADLDQDGDEDVFINMGGAYPGDVSHDALYENPGFGNHWIAVRLVGTRSNRSAIGARIRASIVEKGRRRHVYKWVNSGGSFGASPLRQHLGLGTAERIEELRVDWPTTGTIQRFRGLDADQFIEITEGSARFRRLPYGRTGIEKKGKS